MKRSKKGITLVELVICCAIIVLIGGAATALLMSGEHLFSSSANSASNQMELDVLQSYMMGIIPSAKNIGIATDDEGALKLPDSGNCIYFPKVDNTQNTQDNSTLIVRTGSKETKIHSVTGFKYRVVRAGVKPTEPEVEGAETEKDTARAQFIYTVTFLNGETYQGGFVINNLSYPVVAQALGIDDDQETTEDDVQEPTELDLRAFPIYVSISD